MRTVHSIPAVLVAAALALPAPPGPFAATPAPAPADTVRATPPPSPVSGIRNKISAADLLSAESILEVHRERHGEDGPWLVGYAWVARGALLLGDLEAARRHAATVHAECARRVGAGVALAADRDVAYALGAAIEVEAQRLARTRGRAAALAYVRGEQGRWDGPVSFRSRLQKRANLLAMEGGAAPALVVEDHLGPPPPALAALRGAPVVLYVWDKSCGDCRAQAPALEAAHARFAREGVRFVALTRRYDDELAPEVEKARADSAWKAMHPSLDAVPVVISTASMERYGGSSTPTFAFVDRRGIVRRYTPTRLTREALEQAIRDVAR